MKTFLSIAFTAFFFLAKADEANAGQKDPIGWLVEALNKDGGWWKNGLFSHIKLPADAMPEDVMHKAIEAENAQNKPQQKYKILETRKVLINKMPYYAVLFNRSEKGGIFLCSYEGDSWWNRFVEVPANQMPSKLEMSMPRKSSD